MKGIVEADGPGSFLDATFLVEEQSFRFAHLDRQNQLSRCAAQ